MIILSQSKTITTESVNLEIEICKTAKSEWEKDNLKMIEGKCYLIKARENNDVLVLGRYDTEERAKEILKEIIISKNMFKYEMPES